MAVQMRGGILRDKAGECAHVCMQAHSKANGISGRRVLSRIWFQRFYLDQEKDMIVDLFREGGDLFYVLKTPNHSTGNLITNLARLCGLPLSEDAEGLKIIEGQVPSYVDGYNRQVYIFRLGNTKTANIYPDGTVEMKASVPAIAKTLMSQTKDYRPGIEKTIVKTYIRSEYKFRTDLHTHMNANLRPDVLIALGIIHEIRYPLYYIRKLGLSCTPEQERLLAERRAETEKRFAGSSLQGKYLTRRIDDNTFINFAELILSGQEYAAENIAKIRCSLTILKDGQAVFTNLEKVYLYRYVFTRGVPDERPFLFGSGISQEAVRRIGLIPDPDIVRAAEKMLDDRQHPVFRSNTLFQDKLLWIARQYKDQGICYAEISDTSLVKKTDAPRLLAEVHAVMPAIREETGVVLRLLAGIRRIPLTIIRDNVPEKDYFLENMQVLRAVAADPYVAGSDIIGEEINDIRDIRPVIRELVRIAGENPGFVLRIHAGENDSLRDNVANSIACVREALSPGQPMPPVRIGHGLYTANLRSPKGAALIRDLRESGAVLEFQITSNVRLNNLSAMEKHPLRAYLREGIRCVQGTDGGAIYGTCSIDEQLSLEKMLGLTDAELLQMRRAEDTVLQESMRVFGEKQAQFEMLCRGDNAGGIAAWYAQRIAQAEETGSMRETTEHRLSSAEVLADRITEFPETGMPVVIAGGSFNSDRHLTRVRPDDVRLIDVLLEKADPAQVFFVIGHRLTGYERYLLEKNRGRFRVYAIVPSRIRPREEKRIREAGLGIRVSIEPEAMGLYKSFQYELFKRRRCVLVAFDGNSACANMVQEAKNSRRKCRIYVSRYCRILREKAESLEGYARLFDGASAEQAAEEIAAGTSA